jgi:hypothetical protein
MKLPTRTYTAVELGAIRDYANCMLIAAEMAPLYHKTAEHIFHLASQEARQSTRSTEDILKSWRRNGIPQNLLEA